MFRTKFCKITVEETLSFPRFSFCCCAARQAAAPTQISGLFFRLSQMTQHLLHFGFVLRIAAEEHFISECRDGVYEPVTVLLLYMAENCQKA